MSDPSVIIAGKPITGVKGRIKRDEPLGPRSWFRVGGAADILFQPLDADDLAGFMEALPLEVPVITLGACSNLIIRDGGVEGVVLRLGRHFSDIVHDGDGLLVGGGCLDTTVAEHAAQEGLSGMEFLSGIPGSIGGAVAMNAGAHGSDMAAILDWADVVLRDGRLMRLSNAELGFDYRHSRLPQGATVVRARLRGVPADKADILAHMESIRTAREASQPLRTRTGGSTFRNPDPEISSYKAWELIDMAGCRGLTLGGAQVSEKHCNFLLNANGASAADLEQLGELVRRRVLESTGVSLLWEIKRVGRPLNKGNEA